VAREMLVCIFFSENLEDGWMLLTAIDTHRPVYLSALLLLFLLLLQLFALPNHSPLVVRNNG